MKRIEIQKRTKLSCGGMSELVEGVSRGLMKSNPLPFSAPFHLSMRRRGQ